MGLFSGIIDGKVLQNPTLGSIFPINLNPMLDFVALSQRSSKINPFWESQFFSCATCIQFNLQMVAKYRHDIDKL